ncbi:MAG: HAMP domain-containing protein [Nitrospirae bacterium]|nr:HAMP domain-containing protein [Nitrospirota bacterium]
MAFNIRAKLLIAFFIMLIPFFVFAYLTDLTYRTIHKNVLRMDALHRELDTYSKMQLAIDMLLMPPNDYLITGDIGEKENFIRLAGELEALVDSFSMEIEERQSHRIPVNLFEKFLGSEPEEFHKDEIGFLKELKKDVNEIKWSGIKIFSVEKPVGSKADGVIMEELDAVAHRLITITIARHMATDRSEFANAKEVSARIWMMASAILTTAFIVAAAAGSVFAVYYSRLFVRPIKTLHNGTERLAAGELDHRLNIRTGDEPGDEPGDEIEQLGRAFNIMGEKLKESYSGLEEKVRERTRDLQQRLDELERFREATVHREFRIKELRDKIAELEKELEETRKM